MIFDRARLDANAALQHLYHFCQIIQKDTLQDARPPFAYEEDEHKQVTATVSLPSSVPARIRQTSSKNSWRTEKAARKDAAFHAYKALYEAGLLDDHLLPIIQRWNVNEGLYEMAPPPRMQFACVNVWKPVGDHNEQFKIDIRITPPDTYDELPIDIQLITYTQVSVPPELELHWDAMSTFGVRFEAYGIWQVPSDLTMMHNFTSALYRAPRSEQHWKIDDELLTLFQPMQEEGWMHDVKEYALGNLDGILRGSLIRITHRNKAPYIYLERIADQVECAKLPRRRNFLTTDTERKVEVDDSVKSCIHEARTDVFPSSQCTIESMPLRWARIGLFIPNILQHISDYTVVEKLRSGLLKDVKLRNRGLIRTAITTGSAQRSFDYQRLEFLGDSVLKHVISCHLYHTHQDYPEGYLSQQRSVLVCNATLAVSAYKAGLGQFIISTPVDHRNWTFPSAEVKQPQKEFSSKTLADVVEALIGAAWLEAGFEAARRCVNVFLPETSKESPTNTSTQSNDESIGNIEQVQSIVGYEFTNPALLAQALTHPSYANVARVESYERMEFLGDAVLDMIIANLLAKYLDKLSQGQMTDIKAALVNADLLGFLCLNLKSKGIHKVVVSADGPSKEPQITTKVVKRSLADCMRVQANLRIDSLDRYLLIESYESIIFQLERGHGHPWGMLRELKISKMYSDVVESVIAAIYLDSGQNLIACERFLRQLGLLQYAERVISEELDVRHHPPLT
ncbi:hypothetical protein MRB53_037701 [Persea americana]|nr:hypothetical protein MRB53_037701 [Persea americana]